MQNNRVFNELVLSDTSTRIGYGKKKEMWLQYCMKKESGFTQHLYSRTTQFIVPFPWGRRQIAKDNL